ncbi:unnamed protein product [Allacma fusca]|uniref:Uncharacterized protein n=1 Tax=Allacma fusca TaxID=39272 RepID=A0A8J2KFQ0_9HEXA|nr:unnamed protein product [Allacma fusca]
MQLPKIWPTLTLLWILWGLADAQLGLINDFLGAMNIGCKRDGSPCRLEASGFWTRCCSKFCAHNLEEKSGYSPLFLSLPFRVLPRGYTRRILPGGVISLHRNSNFRGIRSGCP